MCCMPEFDEHFWEKRPSMPMKVQLLSETATLPTKAHDNDACYDIYADIKSMGKEDISIAPHSTILINTGFATEIPEGYWGAIFARSGMASKMGLRPAQGVPVIDEPYRGEWKIPLHNDFNETQVIHHGDRIAQFLLLPYFNIDFEVVDNLSETKRGNGSFGSSGK